MHAVLIAGIALVGLPVLLHLIMKQEPKRVLFPAFRFLKQKRNLNQRKMRLRHFLLLALRMLLIALFAVMLFQPTVYSDGILPLAGEQPVAVVILIDTTPSMGYTANGKTRLDDAKRRALELLDDLPTGSRVAVLDPTDPVGTWEQSVADARTKIEALTEPKGGGPAITAGLPVAYQLLRTVEQDTDAKEPLPKLIAVFSDRAAAGWQADRIEDLKKQRDAVPRPPVAHLYFDVGADSPTNVAITGVAFAPAQQVPAGTTVRLAVTVAATGPDVTAAVRCEVAGNVQRKEIRVPGGSARAAVFDLKDLAKGVHQFRVALETDDNLGADNQRFVTVMVAEPRRILAVADDPADANYWVWAHEAKEEFACMVKRPRDVDTVAGFEAVALLGIADVPRELWEILHRYVEGGGKVFIAPGRAVGGGYDPSRDEFAKNLMPAKLGSIIEAVNFDPPTPPSPDRRNGVTWYLDDAALRHPLLAPFKDWQRQGNVDVLRRPPRAFKYYEAEPREGASVIVRFDDNDDPSKRRPALVERTVGKGKVLLLTTRLEVPDAANPWNNYWANDEHSFATVFPHVIMTYLCGASADKNFQFPTGRDLFLPVPRGPGEPPKKLKLEGPGVSGRDAEIELGERQAEVRIAADKTLTPGNYILSAEKGEQKEGFSLNPPSDESNLAKVPAEAIEDLFGPSSVVPLGKDANMREVLDTKFTQPVDLFPWLLILVLFLLAAEGVIANRFYRPIK